MAQPTHGPRVKLVLGKLLPPGLVAAVAGGPPDAVLRALGQVRVLVETAALLVVAASPQQLHNDNRAVVEAL